MKKKLNLLIAFVLLSYQLVCSQTTIDYKNKALLKTLAKSGINNFDNIVAIPPKDSAHILNNINGTYFSINVSNIYQYKYIYIGRVNSCRAGGCSLSSVSDTQESYEYFDYFILFDSAKTVQQVKVFNYQASHGQEITAKWWLKQFIGYNLEQNFNETPSVDAISGATISVNAITEDLEKKLKLLHIIL